MIDISYHMHSCYMILNYSILTSSVLWNFTVYIKTVVSYSHLADDLPSDIILR